MLGPLLWMPLILHLTVSVMYRERGDVGGLFHVKQSTSVVLGKARCWNQPWLSADVSAGGGMPANFVS